MTLMPRFILPTVLVMLVTGVTAPAYQDSAKKEDEAKAREERLKKTLAVIDEIIKDVESLRLPENRLRLLLQTANAVWPIDEKRARLLCKNALTALKELQATVESSDEPAANLHNLATQLRSELLWMLGQRDPELALDVLRATRPSGAGHPTSSEAAFESQLELQLAQGLAAKDPAKALELAEQGLAKGVSQEVLNLVNTLSNTHREAAQKLFDEVLVRLRSENYTTNPTASYIALNLLHQWLQRHNATGTPAEEEVSGIQALRFSEQAARDLCNVLLRLVLDNSSSAGVTGRAPWGNAVEVLRQMQPMLPGIEKLVPAQAAALEGRIAEMQRFMEMQNGPWVKMQELLNTGSVEDLLTAAGKSQPDLQNHLFQSAVWKAVEAGNSDLARQIVEEKVTDPAMRQSMQMNLEQQLTQRLIDGGKLAEARAQLVRIPSKAERLTFLVRLAAMAMGKNDKNEARQLLNEAEGMMSSRADNYQTLSVQLEIAGIYRWLDPPRGHAMIESAIDRLNELTAAAVTLSGFDLAGYFRNDEFVLANGNSLNQLLQQISSQINDVAGQDADRARALADRVERLEMKAWICLTIIPALLGGQDGREGQSRHVNQETRIHLLGNLPRPVVGRPLPRR